MPQEREIDWDKIDKDITGLATDDTHTLYVKREAIPIIFVPGIMGSRLQLKGHPSRDENYFPKKRWDPSSDTWMLANYVGTPAAYRKMMLIGRDWGPDYLEVIHDDENGDGFEGIMQDYCDKFLRPYLRRDWGPLSRFFDLPVYAVGYNWTARVQEAGRALAEKIHQIKTKAEEVTGLCRTVILVTHSMGGLVSRWASEMAGAKKNILGIIHAVQPTTGSPAAYWRMKAGFEDEPGVKSALGTSVLGNSGDTVTVLLGNSPGGLSLLPNKLHRTDSETLGWLAVNDGVVGKLPLADPYSEIYRVPAVLEPENDELPSRNTYWGLVDPDLLDPQNPSRAADPDSNNALAQLTRKPPFEKYKRLLQMAETMHDQLQDKHHDRTFSLRGVGFPTPNVVRYDIEDTSWTTFRNYPNHGFRGFFRNSSGEKKMAVLHGHTGDGDGTVPQYSSGFLEKFCKFKPKTEQAEVRHQPAFENEVVRNFTIKSIVALCELHFKDVHG